MTSLENATVLVTGANGGLGSALVEAALERGARRVYATARTPKKWDDPRVEPLHLDVSDPASIEQVAASAGDTTILVNNAAVFPRGDLLNSPTDEMRGTIEANLVGPVLMARAFAGALRSAKGTLVNVNSVLSWFAVGKATACPRPACGWRRTPSASSSLPTA
ncbi:SDR family NAD(P)-dependent oxidoreductase [Streptomyces sp. NPDC096142]|uniref:SDR family NAD(P)-dependent oxidoreductase n=1 Tax=Streptomyces sp. NPDC096142 TaxID=3366077 RepID=UPI00380798CC